MTTSDGALQKPNVYETQRIQLTSPLMHIGGAVSRLSPFEYVQSGHRVYLPDQAALEKALQKQGRLNDYIQAIDDREDLTPLLQNAFGEDWHTVKDPEGNPIFPSNRVDVKWTDERITDLRPLIRNGFGDPYIPGSSIKGAIRTALAYHLLQFPDLYNVPKQQHLSQIEERLQRSMGELKRKAKFFDDKAFMDPLFTNFQLRHQAQVFGKAGNEMCDRIHKANLGPNTDFMRAIHISDSPALKLQTVERQGTPVTRNQAIAAEVFVSSRWPNYQAKYRASIFTEFIFNLNTEFTLSIDHEMLSWLHHRQGMKIPFKSISDLLKICQDFAQEQWDFEYDYWNAIKNNQDRGKTLDFNLIRQRYDAEDCLYTLRMGWASGMPGTTVNLLLAEDLAAQVRDTCGLKAPGFEAPKSRRTVCGPTGDIQFVPGWAKFKVAA
ncbi:MAG: type III-A CRISPR-associated RAMP protein Csm5 [Thermosynechococcaceae cyanobacterium]